MIEKPKSIWLSLEWWIGAIALGVAFGVWSWIKAGGHFMG